MSEQLPKKYFVYSYTWRMAEAKRKKYERNGRVVCEKPMINSNMKDPRMWVIWYNREQDTKRLPTDNARYYDK